MKRRKPKTLSTAAAGAVIGATVATLVPRYQPTPPPLFVQAGLNLLIRDCEWVQWPQLPNRRVWIHVGLIPVDGGRIDAVTKDGEPAVPVRILGVSGDTQLYDYGEAVAVNGVDVVGVMPENGIITLEHPGSAWVNVKAWWAPFVETDTVTHYAWIPEVE